MTDKFGDIIISAAIHFDETTPHIHILCIPLIKDTKGNGLKYSSSGLIGNRTAMINFHNDFYERVGKKYDLSRGVEGSRATHMGLKQYHAMEEKKLTEIDTNKELTRTALAEAQKRLQNAEALKARIMVIQNENMKRDAELNKKERDLKEFEKQALSGRSEIPAVPAVLNAKTAVSWQKSVQTLVDNITVGFKSVFQRLQNEYHILLKKYKLLVKENLSLKNRAEKAEKDLASKPIAEIIADREKAVPVKNHQQRVVKRRTLF
jgi:hypothetical protein